MPIPTYDRFIEPVLRYLAQNSQGAPAQQVYEAAADALGLSEGEKLELLPSRAQAVYKNRAGWAHDRLKRAGLSSSVRRGYWKLTDRGFDYHSSHPQKLTVEEVQELALGNLDVRLRPSEEHLGLSSSTTVEVVPQSVVSTNDIATPDDRLERAGALMTVG